MGFNVLERNIPLSVRDTSRSGSRGKELDAILPTQPMDATHSNGVWPPVIMSMETKILIQLLYRVQGFPMPTVRCKGKAAIGYGCLDRWVTLQSDREQVDFVLNRGRPLYKLVESPVDLSKIPHLANVWNRTARALPTTTGGCLEQK